MNFIDKVLLGLLIVILPLGIWGSHRLISQDNNATDSTVQVLDPTKLEELVDQLSNKQTGPVASTVPAEFSLASVAFATESGVLVLNGIAPNGETSVLVSVTVLKPLNPIAELGENEEDSVKGTNVYTRSVVPKTDGGFKFEYEVASQDYESVVELRMEQNLSVKTVRFDLKTRRQVL